MTANNVILEVDHATAVRWGTVRAGIEVQVIRPNSEFGIAKSPNP